MEKLTLTPTVDSAQEFIEIATDFSNPLDLVREAISNSFDAQATEIHISFSTARDAGESILITDIEDNGTGMDLAGLQAFFDLGNSLRRGDPSKIGDKGHGTKVYFNSSEIEVTTTREDTTYRAVMDRPFRTLHRREIPIVEVTKQNTSGKLPGSHIRIKGYNNNRRDRFQQHLLKDYVMWSTKFGSFEGEFIGSPHATSKLLLKGLDVERWSRLSEQIFRVDKWSLCRG
jgi:Histidine kinase-, DNA gyrase B-, and HSP90-like ATPase